MFRKIFLLPRLSPSYNVGRGYVLFSSSSEESAPPIRVGLTADAGRGVFATRRIQSGDLIHTAEPFLVHPSLNVLDKVCYYCLRRIGKMKWDVPKFSSSSKGRSAKPDVTCDLHFMRFCSNRCAIKAEGLCQIEKNVDWSFLYKHCRTKGLKYPLLVKRMACMILSGTASAEELDILQPANHSHMLSPEWEESFGLLRDSFKASDIQPEKLGFLTREWYVNTWLRIHANVFQIELIGEYADLLADTASCISAELPVGNAVYKLTSMYNHDCDPNTHILWIEDAKARIKALRDIEPDEELCICYIDASMEREARQFILYQNYGFHCHCLRCQFET